MAETTADNAGFDLTQFYQVFFEEAGENLENMERLLLEIEIEAADDEELNAIFRCAHSVKGGAATFGFSDVTELTHEMETLLDKLRRRELTPMAPMVDVLLASGDALRTQLARHAGSGTDVIDTRDLLASIRTMVAGKALPAAAHGVRVLELQVGPLDDPSHADGLVDLFNEISGLGNIEPLDGGQPADGMRRFKVTTTSASDDLLDLFSFHVARECVKMLPLSAGYGFHRNAPGAPSTDEDDPGYGIFDEAPGAPAGPASNAAKPAAKANMSATKAPPTTESSTLRVSVDKVDQLINLVGELVITQAMLAQNSKAVDMALHQQLTAGLADLERNTRDLQESVMSIRMIPMSTVFSRFPRMLRDLASKLGKKVDFVTQGEATELDKGMVEKITDPLTHLVRNSCDHGIEMPEERLSKGKSETGTITLAASHQGGSIVIEVRDDGKGLSREALLKKTREKGIDAPDSLTDSEVWNLIFAPGFSTADTVTDVSGRGVGMDVVKKNITSLGGTVDIDSSPGLSMSVKVRLPLTLAIMDGMSVGIGPEVYLLPLSQVVESFTIKPGMVKSVTGSGRVVQVRNEYMQVLDLAQLFDVHRTSNLCVDPIMVVVESDGARVALLVDELLGQQQVVVKNLESNYRKVSNVSGATIMGDGRVALIVDVGSLVRGTR